MSFVVTRALGLVIGILSGALVLIGLKATRNTVRSIGESLGDLLLGGLGRIRSQLLLGLCMPGNIG